MIARNMMTQYDDTEYDDTEYEDPQPSSPPTPKIFWGYPKKNSWVAKKLSQFQFFLTKNRRKKSGDTQNFCGEFPNFLTKIRNKIWG